MSPSTGPSSPASAASGSPASRNNLRDCSELYRRWSGAWEPDRDVRAEHRLILDSAIGRDAEATTRALSDHYERTLRILIADLPPGTSH